MRTITSTAARAAVFVRVRGSGEQVAHLSGPSTALHAGPSIWTGFFFVQP